MQNHLDKIIAHRGASYDFPENTLLSVTKAWELGAKMVEIDVHVTKDNQIIALHDADTKKVGDKKLVAKKSRLAAMQTVDVGAKKSEKFKGEKIPTLSAILKTIPADGTLVIEIKCGLEIIEPLKKLLNNTTLQNTQIEIISFDYDVLSAVKKELPQYKMLWLLDLDYYLPHWLCFINVDKIIRKVKQAHLEGVNVWAGKIINPAFVKKFHQEQLSVYVWTVNKVEKAQEMLSYQIDGLTTDRPAWMAKKLG